jgi:hypothetical protein
MKFINGEDDGRRSLEGNVGRLGMETLQLIGSGCRCQTDKLDPDFINSLTITTATLFTNRKRSKHDANNS